MKIQMRRLLAVILALLLAAGTLVWLTGVTQIKEGHARLDPFFDCGSRADVLFFGTSHVTYGIQPMELWKDHGVSAYNLGSSGISVPMEYWDVVNALDYSSPKLIVLDCCNISQSEKMSGTGYFHLMLDAFPLSVNKLRTVWDLLPAEEYDLNTRFSYIWTFSIFHDRWNTLKPEDAILEVSRSMGWEPCVNVAEPDRISTTDAVMELTEDMPGVEYFKKIVELCEDRGVELLLTYLPFPSGEETHQEANGVQLLAEAYGLKYINMLDMNIVDYETDMYDNASHLNPSGAMKVTSYLGAYIAEHYDLQDHRDDPDYGAWTDTVDPYIAEKQELLRSQIELDDFLMLLRDNDMSFALCIGKGSEIYGEPRYPALIKNACCGLDTQLLDSAVKNGDSYVLVVDKAKGSLLECLGDESLQLAQTSFGPVKYSGGILNINGVDYTPNASEDAKVFVFDTETGENIGADYGFAGSPSLLFERCLY